MQTGAPSTRGIELRSANAAGLLWEAARRFGDRPAILDGEEAWSFAALQLRAAAYADACRRRGVAPGDRVVIRVARSGEAAAAFFGALASGAIACLANEQYRERQLAYVLEHTGARLFVTDTPVSGPAPDCLAPADVAAVGAASPAPRIAGDAAQIIYTSGSTGRPKGVVTSHGALWAGALMVPAYLGIDATDRIAGLLPLSFVYGFSQLACALVAGATLVVDRATLPQDIARGLRERGVSVLAGVPPLWAQLLRAPAFAAEPLPALRILTCAGGRLPPEQVRALRRAQPQARLFLMYGLTEVFRSTFLPPEEVDAHPDSMGYAVPGSEVRVLRDDGTPCEAGEVGELVHRGPTVALGYWNDPEATARVFRPDPGGLAGVPSAERVVFSGDLVRCDEEGRLHYVGRRDRMIKTLGYRVSPEEIVDVLLASGGAAEAAVTSEPDPLRGEGIVAHIVLRAGGDLGQVRSFVSRELPRYMHPVRYVLHEALPRNAAGKLDLLALGPSGRAAAP